MIYDAWAGLISPSAGTGPGRYRPGLVTLRWRGYLPAVPLAQADFPALV
jgi:hypothetical protein